MSDARFTVRQRQRRRLGAGVLGVVLGLLPALAAAQEGRALEPPDDFGKAALAAVLAAGVILLLAAIGRMYQRERGLRWRFQEPEPPADEHGGGH